MAGYPKEILGKEVLVNGAPSGFVTARVEEVGNNGYLIGSFEDGHEECLGRVVASIAWQDDQCHIKIDDADRIDWPPASEAGP